MVTTENNIDLLIERKLLCSKVVVVAALITVLLVASPFVLHQQQGIAQDQLSNFAQGQNLTNIIQTNNSASQIYIPPTISKGAQEILKNLTMDTPTFVAPSSDDLKGWQKLNQQLSPMFMRLFQPIVDRYQPNITATKMGDVNVLDIKPKDWRDNGKVLVYLHGGGYVLLDANSTLGNAEQWQILLDLELYL